MTEATSVAAHTISESVLDQIVAFNKAGEVLAVSLRGELDRMTKAMGVAQEGGLTFFIGEIGDEDEGSVTVEVGGRTIDLADMCEDLDEVDARLIGVVSTIKDSKNWDEVRSWVAKVVTLMTALRATGATEHEVVTFSEVSA